MKTLSPDNAKRSFIELGDAIKNAGKQGIALAEMEATNAYLAGVYTLAGKVALVTRDGRQYIVWLRRRAKNPPVFREEQSR
jgi:hypothetical protein